MHGLQHGHVRLQAVSGVLRTELDVGEHAEAAELRGQEAAHARLAEVQPRQPRQLRKLRRQRAGHVCVCKVEDAERRERGQLPRQVAA